MFFDDLDKKDLSVLEKVGRAVNFNKDEYMIQEGLAGTSFSVILSGRVEVRKKLPGGRFKALVELKPFDLIGELGFFGAPCRSASVIALEATQILEFDHEVFEKFAASNPRIGMIIYRNMGRVLAERLVSNDVDLMDTIIWALGQPRGASPRGMDLGEARRLWVG